MDDIISLAMALFHDLANDQRQSLVETYLFLK